MSSSLKRLAFGETYNTQAPADADVVSKWGARAISRDGGSGFDLVFNRQDNAWSDRTLHDEAHRWIDEVGLPWARAQQWRGNSDETKALHQGAHHIVGSTNASHGYVYLFAWREGSNGCS